MSWNLLLAERYTLVKKIGHTTKYFPFANFHAPVWLSLASPCLSVTPFSLTLSLFTTPLSREALKHFFPTDTSTMLVAFSLTLLGTDTVSPIRNASILFVNGSLLCVFFSSRSGSLRHYNLFWGLIAPFTNKRAFLLLLFIRSSTQKPFLFFPSILFDFATSWMGPWAMEGLAFGSVTVVGISCATHKSGSPPLVATMMN